MREPPPAGYAGMNANDDTHRDFAGLDVDELRLRKWVAAGLAEPGRYLARRAAFDDFPRVRRDL